MIKVCLESFSFLHGHNDQGIKWFWDSATCDKPGTKLSSQLIIPVNGAFLQPIESSHSCGSKARGKHFAYQCLILGRNGHALVVVIDVLNGERLAIIIDEDELEKSPR